MPIVLAVVGLIAALGVGYAVLKPASTPAATSQGMWQALVSPFTIAPGASVAMTQAATTGYSSTVQPLSLVLQQMSLSGQITNYQYFAPGAALPADWPTADTYGPTALRFEFTYPAINPTTKLPNPPLTLPTLPGQVWQLVPTA